MLTGAIILLAGLLIGAYGGYVFGRSEGHRHVEESFGNPDE